GESVTDQGLVRSCQAGRGSDRPLSQDLREWEAGISGCLGKRGAQWGNGRSGPRIRKDDLSERSGARYGGPRGHDLLRSTGAGECSSDLGKRSPSGSRRSARGIGNRLSPQQHSGGTAGGLGGSGGRPEGDAGAGGRISEIP